MANPEQFTVRVEGDGEPCNVLVTHWGAYYRIDGSNAEPIVIPDDKHLLSDIATVIEAILNGDGEHCSGGETTVSVGEVHSMFVLEIQIGGKPQILLMMDGTVEFGEDYEPNAAAGEFWKVVEQLAPECLKMRGVEEDERR